MTHMLTTVSRWLLSVVVLTFTLVIGGCSEQRQTPAKSAKTRESGGEQIKSSADGNSAAPQSPANAGQKFDPAELVTAARATQRRMKSATLAWSVRHQTVRGPVLVFKVVQSPTMRRIEMAEQAEPDVVLITVIERDGFWYTRENADRRSDNDLLTKYRPYETLLWLPLFYRLLALSEPTFAHEAGRLGEVESVTPTTATFRRAVGEGQREFMKSAVQLSKRVPDRLKPDDVARIKAIEDALANGLATVWDRRTGVVLHAGGAGNRVSFEQIRWVGEPEGLFDVSGTTWEDRTNALSNSEGSNLVMFSHSPGWRPEFQSVDRGITIMDVATGAARRLPHRFVDATSGCFSKKRNTVYLPAKLHSGQGLTIVEVDIATGKHRRIGDSRFERGITLFPVLSPDGQTLAVLHAPSTNTDLRAQVTLIGLASNKTRALGEPLDTAFLSWLPDGNGLILVSRKSRGPNAVPDSTICRMDLDGKLTPLRKGFAPVVLAAQSRILFEDEDGSVWKTCRLDGTDPQLFGDGFKDFGFPPPGPDGKRILMMKFNPKRDRSESLRPFLIDIETVKATPVRTGPGFWSRPKWR